MTEPNIKVIFDTNVWISFLIGKKLAMIKGYIEDRRIKIIITNQLIEEIKLVTLREKLQKYFQKESVIELIELLEAISDNIEIRPTHLLSRDKKDNFLLDLIDFAKADYLVTGDKDLLELNPFQSALIFNTF